MRIILEATEDQQGRKPEETYPRVTIEIPSDELSIGEILEHLVSPALEAYGYAADAIDDALQGKEEKGS